MNSAIVVHPATLYVQTHGFDALVTELKKRVEAGHLTWREGKDDLADLVTVCYSKICPVEGAWDEFTTMARGLILDVVGKKVVSTPFPKFFNYLEQGTVPPKGEGFECLEKLDGSLIIAFWWNGKIRCATKGSFYSDQAKWAEEYVHSRPEMLATLTNLQGATFLFEAIYRANQIVVKYEFEGLVLLGGYSADGVEITRLQQTWLSRDMKCRMAAVTHFDSIEALAEAAQGFSGDMEGYVVRFDSGLRLKVKGATYVYLHRLISRITPLAVWDNMRIGTDMVAIRKEIPEEFWVDFDDIVGLLETKLMTIVTKVTNMVEHCVSMSNKDIGLSTDLEPVGRQFIFMARKDGPKWPHNPKTRRSLFECFRPTGNVLEGYTASMRFKNVENETG
jgi:RNA ligase